MGPFLLNWLWERLLDRGPPGSGADQRRGSQTLCEGESAARAYDGPSAWSDLLGAQGAARVLRGIVVEPRPVFALSQKAVCLTPIAESLVCLLYFLGSPGDTLSESV